jgi:hypothetical protein
MKRLFGVVVLSAIALVGGVTPAQGVSAAGATGASSFGVIIVNVPGRFCKRSDIGKKIKTAKYGTIECKREGNRARWKRV